MPILEAELARRESGRLELRATPLRVRWALDDLVSADGHRLNGSFSASVQALSDKANRRMLEEVFLGRSPVLSAEDVVAHFAPAVRAAALNAASLRPAGALLAADAAANGIAPTDGTAAAAGGRETGRQEMIDALCAAGKAVAFSCGLELLPAFQLELESPSFRRQKQEELERALAEQRAAGQVKHFERAAQLLKQFEAVRQSAPQLSAGAVLEQISAADRGTMLQTLLMASARESRTQSLWVAAGPYLVRVDAHGTPPKTELIPLPPTLGPLRSVHQATTDGRTVLLVGARTGVMLVRPDAPAGAPATPPAEPQLFHDPAITSLQGFSRAVLWKGSLWACHGEGGIVRWKLGPPDGAAPTLPDLVLRPEQFNAPATPPAPDKPPQVRHLAVLDESRLIFSAGERLVTLTADGVYTMYTAPAPSGSPSRIIALLPDEQKLHIVHDDGTLCTRDRATLELVGRESRGVRIVSAGVLPWLGSRRLLLAGESGPVQCVGFDDPLVTEYVSPHRAPSLVAGAADLVAAVSADRQRLVLWNSWDGRRPVGEVPIASVAKHRVAGLEFA